MGESAESGQDLHSTEYFRLGDWMVKPSERSLQWGEQRVVIEPRAMDVLLQLAGEPGTILTAEALLERCWAGTFYGDNPVHKAIAQLRKALGDKAGNPDYIETIRKRGYRLIAAVSIPEHFQQQRLSRSWSDGSPYLGLEAFDGDHADVFFGRDDAIAQLLKQIRDQQRSGTPFVLTLGPSGSGKSSLIKAGIIPALMARHGAHDVKLINAQTLDMRSQQAADPLRALSDTLAQWHCDERPVYSDAARANLYQWLLNADYAELLEPVQRATQRYRQQHKLDDMCLLFGLVVDQLEQISANPELQQQQRMVFVEALQQLVQSGQILILATARNDFYQEMMRLEGLSELKSGRGQYDLLPPTAGEITEMIRKPAAVAGLRFEQEQGSLIKLDDQLRDDAISHPDILPLLQYTLNELYHHRDQDGMLCFSAYRKLGGLQGAISRKVETVVESLDTDAQASLGYLLGRLVMQTADNVVASRSTDWTQIHDANEQRLAQALVDSRLLTSELVSGRQSLSVTHEALFEHWPRARRWIETNRELLRNYADLHAAALRWQTEQYRPDYLLTAGKPLLEARQLENADQIQLEPVDQQFIKASQQQAGRRSLLRRGAIAALVMLSVLLGVAGIVAIDARRDAEQRQAQAEDLVGFMLGDLTERLRPLGRLNILAAVGDKAMAYLTSVPASQADPDTALLHAKALLQIGEIRLSQEDTGTARKAFLEATFILGKLTTGTHVNPDILLEAGNAQYWVAETYRQAHDYVNTRMYYTGYHDYATQWVQQDPDNQRANIELSYALNNLGTLATSEGQHQAATDFFNQSVALKEQVLASQPDNINLARELADSYSWLGTSASKAGELNAAGEYFQRGYDLLDELIRESPDDTSLHYMQVLVEMNISSNAIDRNQLDMAQSTYADSMQTMQRLVAIDPSNTGWQRDIAYLQIKQGWLLYLQGNQLAAEHALNTGLQGMQKLTAADPLHAGWAYLQSYGEFRLAIIKQAQGNDARASKLLNAVIGKLRPQLQSNAVSELEHLLLAKALIQSGQIDCSRKDGQSAQSQWQQAYSILQPLAEASHDVQILEPWVTVNAHLGNNYSTILSRLNATGYVAANLQQRLNRENFTCQSNSIVSK